MGATQTTCALSRFSCGSADVMRSEFCSPTTGPSAQSEPAFVNRYSPNNHELCQAQNRPPGEHERVWRTPKVSSESDSCIKNLHCGKNNDRSASLRCAAVQDVVEMIATGPER